jgi:hypothetical protein
LAERPDDPLVLFSLGAIAVERQDWSTALGHLQRSLRGSAPSDSIVRKFFTLIARCHQMLGDLAAALNACSEDLRVEPDDAAAKHRNESRSLPPGSASPMPSASAREVSRNTANPAPAMKRPCSSSQAEG